jgi:hypothetical protein
MWDATAAMPVVGVALTSKSWPTNESGSCSAFLKTIRGGGSSDEKM